MKHDRGNLKADKGSYNKQKHQQSKILVGLLVIAFGILVLLRQMGVIIPGFLFSWKVLLIAIGLVMLIKHGFQKTSAYVLILIGSIFLFNDFYPDVIEIRLVLPVVIIVAGVSILVKAMGMNKSPKVTLFKDEKQTDFGSPDDYVTSSAIFGSDTKNIVSKNFKGANITTVFGGTELNFMHADFENEATIDLTTVFGGVTLIIPANWTVASELTTIFGGIDDKRSISSVEQLDNKTIILKGSCVFGGVDISNYA